MNLAYDRTSGNSVGKVSNSSQFNKIVEVAKREGHYPVTRFSDKGESGAKVHRPGLDLLLAEIKSSEKQRILYVWKYDRLSRNVTFALEFMEICDQHNVTIRSIYEPIPSGFEMGLATQKMFLQMLFIQAEFQRETITENIRSGLHYKRETKQYLSPNITFGYRLKDMKVHKDTQESKVVQQIFDLYCSEQYGYQKIANILNKEGINHRGTKFSSSYINFILGNEMYIGKIKGGTFGKYEGNFPNIITLEQFEKAKGIRKSRNTKHSVNRFFPLRKKIVCPYCNRKLGCTHSQPNKQGTRYFYYRCVNKACGRTSFNAIDIEQDVLKIVSKFVQGDVVFKQLVKELQNQQKEWNKSQTTSMAKEKKKKQQLMKKFENGEIDAQELKESLAEISSNYKTVKTKSTQECATQLHQLLNLKNIDVKKIIVNLIVRIEVTNENQIKGVFLNGIDESII